MNVPMGKELCYFSRLMSLYRILHYQHLAFYQAHDHSVMLSVPIPVLYAG